MATIYRAHQPGIERDVAVKVLPRQFTHDPTFSARFQREAEVAARMQHPRILPIYDIGEHDGQPYIVMAYMPGGTLEDLIQSYQAQQFPLDLVVRYVSQIAEGLDFLHSQGIVHRDFKPSNVLIDAAGDCFIADFGIAKVQEATMQLTLTALRCALAKRVPTIHHSDQGSQYAVTDYIDLLAQHHVQVSMAATGTPQDNGYAERLIRTIKEEEVYLSDYRTFAEAYTQIGHFIEDVYQTKRIHSALGYLTPVEFEATWAQLRAEQMSSLMPG